MILVRFIFKAKWGKIDEAIAELKARRQGIQDLAQVRVLSDLSGPLNTIVWEMEVEGLGEWERVRAELFRRETPDEWAKRIELLDGGRQSIIRLRRGDFGKRMIMSDG